MDRYEWDFSSCPEEERNICLHYEYAREFVRARPNLAAKLAKYPRPQPYGNAFVFAMSKETNQDGLPLMYAGFPKRPWLSILPRQRRSLIFLCKPLPEEDPDDPGLLVADDFDVSQLQKWDAEREKLSAKWHSDNAERSRQALEAYKAGKAYEVESTQRPVFCDGPKRYYALDKDKAYAVIKLDWNFSDRQLRLAFDRLLQRNPRKKSGGKSKATSRVGRGHAGDRLNWLGARRLYKHCGTYDAAIRHLDSLRATNMDVGVYSDADALRKAVEKADRCLVNLVRAGRFAPFSVFDRVE